MATSVTHATVLRCPKCGSNMVAKNKTAIQMTSRIVCVNPDCNNGIQLPQAVEEVEVLDERCPSCTDIVLKKIRVKLTQGAFPNLGTVYETCVGGCDRAFNFRMGINDDAVRGSTFVSNVSGASSGAMRESLQIRRMSALWANPPIPSNSSMPNTNRRLGEDGTCDCGDEVKLWTVHKAGPNRGREFYGCPCYPRHDHCDFFEWAD